MLKPFWTTGYSKPELDAAQEQFGLEFPPDLIELLLDRRPAGAPDWRTDHQDIVELLAWPLKGILFDIENNEFWMESWGEKPDDARERAGIAAGAVQSAPQLIPLFAHRFLPAEPAEVGNPVFSVFQTDIIYYGSDLDHYFANEIGSWTSKPQREYRYIRFWSDLAG